MTLDPSEVQRFADYCRQEQLRAREAAKKWAEVAGVNAIIQKEKMKSAAYGIVADDLELLCSKEA